MDPITFILRRVCFHSVIIVQWTLFYLDLFGACVYFQGKPADWDMDMCDDNCFYRSCEAGELFNGALGFLSPLPFQLLSYHTLFLAFM